MTDTTPTPETARALTARIAAKKAEPAFQQFARTMATPVNLEAIRAQVLREAADECDEAGGKYAGRALNDHAAGAFDLMETFLRKANEAEYVATPCDSMSPCEDGGEPCHIHERLMAHAEGEHELCEPDCGTAPPAVPSVVSGRVLRDRVTAVRRALAEADGFDFDSLEPHDYQRQADAVVGVLAGTDRASVLLWAADQIDAETRQLKADGVLEPDKFRPCRDAAEQLRQLAAEAAVTPPPALTEEGRLRAQVEVLTQDNERDRGLAKVGARCMRDGHQGLIERGRVVLEGWRFALSTALDLGTGAPWEAILERAKELRRLAAETQQTQTETPELPYTHTDDDGDSLQIGTVMATAYEGEGPVVWMHVDQHQGDDQATVYVRPERVEEVVAALRAAGRAAVELGAPAVPVEAAADDRIVAHRPVGGRSLHCLSCAPLPAGDIWESVTAEELEDGGLCTVCGVDVLIPPQSA